jgi:tetratricopeptide (TPR) repeat protein
MEVSDGDILVPSALSCTEPKRPKAVSMPHPYLASLQHKFLIAVLVAGAAPVWAFQASPAAPPRDADVIKQAPSPKASAYYHFALGHLYQEMAEALGNKAEYLNKAIDNYKLAMQEDPSASFLVEEVAGLYIAAGRIREAVLEAEQAIKANPDDLNSRRVLAHIYTQQIGGGDGQSKRIDEAMVKRAIEQYKYVTEKDPKDVESLVMLGRLYTVTQDSPASEAAFNKALEADPDSEDAMTGLAMVYSNLGDSKHATEILEKLSTKNPSARGLMALAQSYDQLHEYSLAANAFRRALALDPSREDVKLGLAQELAQAEQYDEALKNYQEVAEANPRDPQAYLKMAQIYQHQKKFDLAHDALAKAAEIEPDDMEIKLDESLLDEDEGKVSAAIVALKQVLNGTEKSTYNPSDKQFRVGLLDRLGRLFLTLEDFDEAVKAYRDIGTVDPDLAARAEAQVIETYRQSKDFKKALEAADAAMKKYPNDRFVLGAHAMVLADLGRGDQAVAELKKSVAEKPDRQGYMSLAELYERTKDFADMNKALDEAEKLSKGKDEQVGILFMRGAMYERDKKYDLAEKQFREVLKLDPDNTSALNYLGYMFADQDIRLQEAAELIEKAVAAEPNNGAFLDSLGWVYYRQNKLKEAEEQLDRSIQLMTHDPTIHDHLGDVYFKEGRIKEAIAQWQMSLAEWDTSPASEKEPEEIAKVQKKLDSARVRLAKENTHGSPANN